MFLNVAAQVIQDKLITDVHRYFLYSRTIISKFHLAAAPPAFVRTR